jgi:hypothetical protein
VNDNHLLLHGFLKRQKLLAAERILAVNQKNRQVFMRVRPGDSIVSGLLGSIFLGGENLGICEHREGDSNDHQENCDPDGERAELHNTTSSKEAEKFWRA